VRLDRIQDADLNLFEFDYDLTMMVFFLNADEHVYGRYGGRDATSADARQSLKGLRYAMQAALDTHCLHEPPFEKPRRKEPRTIWQVSTASRSGRGCIHCHDVKEALNEELRASGQWSRDRVYRYPLPDNLGLLLEVDRGDVVEKIVDNSPAAKAGLKQGDVLDELAGVPVSSIADAQFALDRAPPEGKIEVSWLRNEQPMSGELELPSGWKKSDLGWRPSMLHYLPFAPLFGRDLEPEEKRALGLSEKQLAFAQEDPVHKKAVASGILPGDIILGVDDQSLEMEAYQFRRWVRDNYLLGDTVRINVLRDGQPLKLPLELK
jgi:hypothetical protein